ncbi:MAG: phage tail protein [Rouxiella aceris]|uniref:phage tail protein n=1 Tax=Rouxiella aceris TaxID=2703884 RepID=UPI00283AFD5A|nr:phage tail protein [Rouxiella aceris]MDR3432053.1 phage tail protein [Rouxiella aceris]
MTTKFFALLTNQGAAKLANAAALGTKVQITQMGVGDGAGVLPTPNPAQTTLIAEKRRAPLNALSVDAANSSQIIAEQIIPENEGGFWIREVGLYDSDGTLIAVANCPETYKPQLAEGSGRTQTVRMILIINSTDAVTLKIDPSVVLATRQYVDDHVIEVKAYADSKLKAHSEALNPHAQYLQIGKLLAEVKESGAEAVNQLLANIGLGAGLTGIVGTAHNAAMTVPTTSASATFTADELIVATALGGIQYRLSLVNKSVNLGKTGPGGMDSGSAPLAGFVGIYVIYNPATGVCALLAVNATATKLPKVYSGANMPAGFTASALVSIWPTTASGQFLAASQRNHIISLAPTAAITTNAIYPTGSTLSIAGIVPKNADTVSGSFILYSTETSSMNGLISVSAARFGEQGITATVGARLNFGAAFSQVPLVDPQVVGIIFESSTGTPTFSLFITSYTI